MFYHSRKLKYVVYGKVRGFAEKDDDFFPACKWLGQYCGYCPQVWLSKSSSWMTGKRIDSKQILFGFDYIKGFPVDSDTWDWLLPFLIGQKGDNETLEKKVKEAYNNFKEGVKETYPGSEFELSYENWRDKYLFVENDQVVVPSLNLKSAKEIICRNEKQKKALRKMGFIKDRIKIMNMKVKQLG